MKSEIDDFLDEVDRWKEKVHLRLKGLTPKQRAEYWAGAARKARLHSPSRRDGRKLPSG